MSPRRSELIVLALACLAPCAAAAPSPPDETEAFLRDHHLDAMLETYLQVRLDGATPAERRALAESLGRLYVERLATETDPAERDHLFTLASDLLAGAASDEALDLRVGLAIARFRPAEQTAEQADLLLATPEEIERATTTLDVAATELDRLGQQLEREVLYDERQARVRDDGADRLAESRRELSLAKYYAGWAYLHLARLSAEHADAQHAIDQFAWVLDTPNEEPSLERLPRSLLRFDHVARSAIGVALAKSVLGRDDDAIAWLDALADADISDSVAAQVFARRITVLSAAGRWSPLALQVQAWQQSHPGPLDEPAARLLAVRALGAMRESTLSPGARDAASRLAEQALGNLMDRGSSAQVLDLIRRFGDVPLRGNTFAVQYIRGAAAFDQARLAHRDVGSPQTPTPDKHAAELYAAARALLDACLKAPDAPDHPEQRFDAATMSARCAYFTGHLADAADAFLAAERVAPTDSDRAESLWMAVVCLDTLADQDQTARPRALELSRRFLADHPSHPRASLLLLRTLDADLVAPARAIEILRAVPDDDPIAPAAKRQLARLLYTNVRAAAPADRARAATDFLAIARALLDADLRENNPESLTGDQEAEALLRARQILDVALLAVPPMVAEAERTLAIAERIPLSTDPEIAAELRLRRVQLSLAKGDLAGADAAFAGFATNAGRSRDAANEVLFADAARAWSEREHTDTSAHRVIRYGSLLLESQSDRAPPAVTEPVAEAAEWTWTTEGDRAMRELAITLDKRALDADRATAAGLHRLARLAESADRPELAKDAWLAVLATTKPASAPWFEARYHSLRLLAATDPQGARAAYDQTAALYPSLGGDEWAPRFAELNAALPAPEVTP